MVQGEKSGRVKGAKKRKGLRWDKGRKVQVGQSECIRKVLSTV